MISVILSRVVIILFGTLYPAYASYKAVKTKNVKEYVKWMMYWIVYAVFTCIEAFADIFISWIPFYYEIKIIIIIWLMLPATKGASVIYKKFIHPQLSKREEEIDKYIAKASDQGYSTLVNIGYKGFDYATNVILSTALKSQLAISEKSKKSYSMNDLSKDEDDVDDGGVDNDYEDDDDLEVVDGEKIDKDKKESEKVRRRKSSKQHPDFEPLDEDSEAPKTRARTKKKSHDHNEVYHTLPRQARHTRSSPNTQD